MAPTRARRLAVALPDDMLDLAASLATGGVGRPRQADLRRAISTAYYALFHRLIDDACRMMISGRGSDSDRLRGVLRRAFGHQDMLDAAKSFRSANMKRAFRPALDNEEIPDSLRRVADAFFRLQQARHEADYNLAVSIAREDAITSVETVQTAFRDWEQVQRSHAARVFLTALLTYRQMRT